MLRGPYINKNIFQLRVIRLRQGYQSSPPVGGYQPSLKLRHGTATWHGAGQASYQLSFHTLKLTVIEVGIKTVRGDQFIMIPLFNDGPLVHDQYRMGFPDR